MRWYASFATHHFKHEVTKEIGSEMLAVYKGSFKVDLISAVLVMVRHM